MSLTTFHRPPPLRWLLRLLPPPKVMYIGGSDVLPPPLNGAGRAGHDCPAGSGGPRGQANSD